MALATANPALKREGSGRLYLVPAPVSGITDAEDYAALFFSDPAAKKALLPAVKQYATMDKSGLTLKITPSKTKFETNAGPNVERRTGIESATAEFTFFEVDPAHLGDLLGAQAADLIQVAAASGVAKRDILLVGASNYTQQLCALYRMASPTIPGEFTHYLFTNASMLASVELKMAKNEAMTLKVELQLEESPFLNNASGNGVILITDDPTAPAL